MLQLGSPNSRMYHMYVVVAAIFCSLFSEAWLLLLLSDSILRYTNHLLDESIGKLFGTRNHERKTCAMHVTSSHMHIVRLTIPDQTRENRQVH